MQSTTAAGAAEDESYLKTVNDNETVVEPSIDVSDIYQRLDNSRNIDNTYGVRKLRGNRLVLGDKDLKFTPKEVHIIDNGNNNNNNVTPYSLTSGLCDLLLDKDVGDTAMYSENDLNAYRRILDQTSAHLTKNKRKIKYSQGKKYNFITKLFAKPGYESSPQHPAVGKGVNMRLQKYNLIYWNNANELVQRLRLLYASLAAGNTGVRNEIIAICEELVECGLLRKIPNV